MIAWIALGLNVRGEDIMKILYNMWIIVDPEGGHCPFLMQPTRKECLTLIKSWHPDPWPKLRRQGWKCKKVGIVRLEGDR